MKTKIYLAPMSGVTNLAFRLMCRRSGAKHCFFEMLHSNSVIYNHPNTGHILKTQKSDSPISAQLLGDDPHKMLDAALMLTGRVDISFLDVNGACPAKKVVKKGEGAALLKDRRRLGRIIKKLSCGLKVPVTVKLRTGFRTRDVKECVRTAGVCESSGASVIFIHGRTQAQGYAGEIDYGSIRAVKDAVKIPVFGSGNIFNPATAKRMLDETGCDGILVARGAMGNPWIFKDIEEFLKNGREPKPPSLSMKIGALKKHLGCMEKYIEMPRGNKLGLMGQVAVWYLKGFYNAARARDRVFRARTYEELLAFIDDIEGSLV